MNFAALPPLPTAFCKSVQRCNPCICKISQQLMGSPRRQSGRGVQVRHVGPHSFGGRQCCRVIRPLVPAQHARTRGLARNRLRAEFAAVLADCLCCPSTPQVSIPFFPPTLIVFLPSIPWRLFFSHQSCALHLRCPTHFPSFLPASSLPSLSPYPFVSSFRPPPFSLHPCRPFCFPPHGDRQSGKAFFLSSTAQRACHDLLSSRRRPQRCEAGTVANAPAGNFAAGAAAAAACSCCACG